jgi:hypothetical protein
MTDGSKDRPNMTAALDLGDKYSYLCLIDTQSGEVMEEGRLSTTPEAFRRPFVSEQPPMRIAIEAGTHSPWASRVLVSARVRHWLVAARSSSTQGTRSGQILRRKVTQVPGGEFPQQGA